MSNGIKKILVVPKQNHPDADLLAKDISQWLEANYFNVHIMAISKLISKPAPHENWDLVVVLGGDGTLLYVARSLLTRKIPFLGINFGKVGFLAEISPDEWKEVLSEILIRQKFISSKRIALKYEVVRHGKIFTSGCSINDVVISRDGLARLLELNLKFSDSGANFKFRADGVIVSTPNGSTGYCAAAGGSLIFPELNVMEICPVCPFLTGLRPIVVSDKEVISIEIGSTQQGVSLTIDGQEGFFLSPKDIVKISKHEYEVEFLLPQNSSYIKKLISKGYI
ncbi:NAD(+)/NADH kinase [Desulfothermus sp.]